MRRDNTVRFIHVEQVLGKFTALATEFDPAAPDPDLDVHAFRPWRGAIAARMYDYAMEASGANGLNDAELGVFHFWRLLEGPWVLPDHAMEFPFIGLPDAIITRAERRAGRWVHKRRELRNPDRSPAGQVGSVRPRRPEALSGRRGLMASREAVSVLWRGPGGVPGAVAGSGHSARRSGDRDRRCAVSARCKRDRVLARRRRPAHAAPEPRLGPLFRARSRFVPAGRALAGCDRPECQARPHRAVAAGTPV